MSETLFQAANRREALRDLGPGSMGRASRKSAPCTHNPLGVKGCCGEAGAIGSPPAVIKAICNAIGVKNVDLPATPHTVWQAADGAR